MSRTRATSETVAASERWISNSERGEMTRSRSRKLTVGASVGIYDQLLRLPHAGNGIPSHLDIARPISQARFDMSVLVHFIEGRNDREMRSCAERFHPRHRFSVCCAISAEYLALAVSPATRIV